MTEDARAERNLRRTDYRHFLTVPTRWMDNDVYGHVNNVTYYSYFDTVVNEFLVRFTGLDFRAKGPVGMVVETGCRFHSEIAFPDVLEVGLRVRRLGKTSVTYEIGIFKAGREAPAATEKPKRLFTGTTQEKSAPGQTLRRGSRYSVALRPRLR